MSTIERLQTSLLLVATMAMPAFAQGEREDDPYVRCGRQAVEAGLKGASETSEFVTGCAAQKRVARNDHRARNDREKPHTREARRGGSKGRDKD